MASWINSEKQGWGLIGLLAAVAALMAGCGLKEPLPLVDPAPINCRVVNVSPGPEDFVLDIWGDVPRLLVSAHDRRTDKESGIFVYEIATGAVRKLQRQGDADRLKAFRPHGLDIRRDGDVTLLYVILHDPFDQGARMSNAVGIYEVGRDEIRLKSLLEDERCLWSPNDLSVLETGEIYLTNDYRGDLDVYFKRRASEIAYFNPDQNTWSIVADRLKLANGILAQPSVVYVTTTLGNTLYAFDRGPDGTLSERRNIARIKGLDNIMMDGNTLLVTAHFDDLAFLRHKGSAEKPAPTAIFRVNPETGEVAAVYADSGDQYSAASTALIWNNQLFASQVFDPFLLVCDMP